ncbi:MAG: flavodoxin domain-containing protein, partial [Chitinophagaceae bacterium]
MLNDPKLKLLNDLVNNSTREEISWINGYLTGILKSGPGEVPANQTPAVVSQPAVVPGPPKKLTLAYGTETGNAKKLAGKLAATAKKKGINFKLTALDTYRFNELEKEQYFFVIISTQGEGEPPIPAKPFYDHVTEKQLQLSGMNYSVLALGDTSYPLYCKTGEEVDVAFEKHGARRVLEIQRCDVDYDSDAAAWFEKVMQLVSTETSDAEARATSNAEGKATMNVEGKVTMNGQDKATINSDGNATTAPAITDPSPVKPRPPAGKKYYQGKVLTNIILNDVGSD